MNPTLRRAARKIALLLIIITVPIWIFTIAGWWRNTDPRFEPANVAVAAILSVLVAAFGWLGKEPDKTAEQVKFAVLSNKASLSAGGVEYVNQQFLLSPDLTVNLHAQICTHNLGSPALVRLSIDSIEPNAVSLTDIDIVVKYKKQPNWGSIELGNPFSVVSGDRNIDVSVKLPFSVTKIEHIYGTLASLKAATIIFRVDLEANGQHLLLDPMRVDLTPVHRQIEKKVTSKIPKYQVGSTQAINTEQLIPTMKRYWLGPDKTEH